MRTSEGRGERYPPGVQLALFALTPAPAAARSAKAETRLKILAGVVALGVLRKEAAAARAFLQAVEASTLNERDRATVRGSWAPSRDREGAWYSRSWRRSVPPVGRDPGGLDLDL